MENTKKMILIEPNVIEKLKEKITSNESSLTRLDKEMHKIMNSKLDDRKKWALYFQTLQRYLHFSDEKKQALKLTVVHSEEENDSKNQERQVDMQSETFAIKKHDEYKTEDQSFYTPDSKEGPSGEHTPHIYTSDYLMRLIPKTYKKNGEVLLKTIHQNPDKIKWDEQGTVFINKKAIPNSNIIDLVNDSLRHLKRPKPIAWEEFTKTLIDIGVPSHCFGNRESQEYIKKYCFESSREDRDLLLKSTTSKSNSASKRALDWERWNPY